MKKMNISSSKAVSEGNAKCWSTSSTFGLEYHRRPCCLFSQKRGKSENNIVPPSWNRTQSRTYHRPVSWGSKWQQIQGAWCHPPMKVILKFNVYVARESWVQSPKKVWIYWYKSLHLFESTKTSCWLIDINIFLIKTIKFTHKNHPLLLFNHSHT